MVVTRRQGARSQPAEPPVKKSKVRNRESDEGVVTASTSANTSAVTSPVASPRPTAVTSPVASPKPSGDRDTLVVGGAELSDLAILPLRELLVLQPGRWPGSSVREFLFSRLRNVWLDGAVEEGVVACRVYAMLGVLDPSLTEAETEFLCRAELSRAQAIEGLAVLGKQWKQQVFSDLASSRAVAFCFNHLSLDGSISLLCGIWRAKPDQVKDTLVERFADLAVGDKAKLVLALVAAGGHRAGVELVSYLHAAHAANSPDSYTAYVRKSVTFLRAADFAAVATFTVQVISYHAVKQQQFGLISALLDGLPVVGGESGQKTVKLPRPLFPLALPDEKDTVTIEPCEECHEAISTLPEKYNLHTFGSAEQLGKIGLFRCACCRRLFSSDCEVCGSCPVEADKARTCWGCGYRLMALSALDGEARDTLSSSTDTTLVASYLALSALPETMSLFVREYLFPSLPLGEATGGLGQGGQEGRGGQEGQFSPAFALELQMNLGLGKKIQAIGHNLVKALLAASPPSAASLKALAGAAGKYAPLHSTVEQFALTLLRSQEPLTRLGNNIVAVLLAVPVSAATARELVFTMETSRLQISIKKQIVRIAIAPWLSDLDLTDAFLQYLSVDELWDGVSLCDLFVEALNRFWKSAPLPDFAPHFMHVASQFELSLLFRARFAAALDPSLVAKLLHSPVACDAEKGTVLGYLCGPRCQEEVGPKLVSLVESNEADTGVLRALAATISLTTTTPQRMHQLVYSRLIPMIVGGNSATVRAAAHLIAAIDKILAQPEAIAAQLVEKLRTGNDSVRNAWAVASLVEVGGGANWVLPSTNWVLTSHCSDPQILPLLGFLVTNPTVREEVITRPEFLEPLDVGLASPSFQARALDVLIAAMHSAGTDAGLVASGSLGKGRPDGGVMCRSLSRFFPRIATELLFDARPWVVAKALRAIQLMDQLGIVNRHTLPPLLLARYVVSVPVDSGEADDGLDVNLFAWTLFRSTYDARFKHSLVPTVLCEVRRRLARGGASGSATRFVEFLFPQSASELSKKEDAKHGVRLLWNELERDGLVGKDHVLAFLAAALVCGIASVPEEKGAFVEKAIQQNALTECFVFVFLSAEMAVGRKHLGRSEMVAGIVQRYCSRTLSSSAIVPVEPAPKAPATRKRRRSSLDRKKPVTKKARRKTVAEIAEGSSDDEYTAGATSEEEEADF